MKRGKKKCFYEVEDICDCRIEAGRKMYLIKWKDWEPKDNTWEPIENLTQVKDMVQQFQKKRVPSKSKNNKNVSKSQSKREDKSPTNLFQKMKKNIEASLDKSEAKKINFQNFQFDEQNQIIRFGRRGRPSEQLIQQMKLLKKHFNLKEMIKLEHNASTPQQQSHLSMSYIGKQKSYPQSKSVKTEKCQPIYSSEQNISEADEQEDQMQSNIISVIKKGLNITKAKLYYKKNECYFSIPFRKDGQQCWMQICSGQIQKINSRWLIRYYEGFL